VGASQINLDALDGHWDELEEDCEFTIGVAQVGLVTFSVRAYNKINFKSKLAFKSVYFAGVHYDRVLALPMSDRIVVGWETLGETFGAKFDVYRLERGQAMPGTPIAQNVRPYTTGPHGQLIYHVQDLDVVAGSDYRYYINGVFDLPFEGGTRTYSSKSKVVGQTAMLEIVNAVSNLAPNPTRGAVTFSVSVPRSIEQTPRGPARLPTEVDVSVYNVRGQLMRNLKHSGELNSVLTMRWDGTMQDGEPVPSGVYFLRVIAGEVETVRKIVLLR